MKILVVTALLIAAALPVARACQICIPFPKKSAADFVLESDVVILAREDPARPFHFSPVELLKGDPGKEPIDLFLDSSTRRILANFPERSVIIVRTDEKGEPAWRRIGVADSDTEPLLREILNLKNDWQEAPKKRVDFFAKLLGHDNDQIYDLAHLEVARAPYSEIRRLRNVLPREEIRRFLADVRYLEWHALYVLLLAQSGDPADQKFVEDALNSAAKFGTTTRLAALATAAIELNKNEAITTLQKQYFQNPNRKPEELKAVVQALSVHGKGGHIQLREQIAGAYRSLLEVHPKMALQISGDLVAWKRVDFAPVLKKIAADPPATFDFQKVLVLRNSVRTLEKENANRKLASP